MQRIVRRAKADSRKLRVIEGKRRGWEVSAGKGASELSMKVFVVSVKQRSPLMLFNLRPFFFFFLFFNSRSSYSAPLFTA